MKTRTMAKSKRGDTDNGEVHCSWGHEQWRERLFMKTWTMAKSKRGDTDNGEG
ncbi:MAG: hypothetical protein RMJ44_09070 [Cytophagales bacterium]|nr:hypothetical protein [Cytophagales bacterium]